MTAEAGTGEAMTSPTLERIVELQSVDLAIDRLRHRAAQHPARGALAQIDGRLADHDAAAAEVEQRRHAVERQRKRLEDEVAMLQERRRDIDAKLYGGDITASKELLALQDEAATVLERQTAMDDEQLELMEGLDELDHELAERAASRTSLEAERAEVERELAVALAEIDAEVAELERQRATLASPEPGAVPGWDDVLARYERLRPQYGGDPVARLVDGHCDGCHIQLSAVALDRIGKLADDETVACEECGRLLVR